MGTFTAQILVGQKHSYDGGIINISHALYLSENDRPAWLLTPMDIFHERDQSVAKRITWIPTLEHMLEDALVMIGLYILKDEKLTSLAEQYFQNPKSDFMELYDDIQPKHLEELYTIAKSIISSHKIVISVFQGSSIFTGLSVLKDYQNDIEVCQSIYRKELSPWSGNFETNGELD